MVTYVYICTNGACRFVERQGYKRTHSCPKCGTQMRLDKVEK